MLLLNSDLTGASLEGAVIGIAILVWFIFRQFRPRRVTSVFNFVAPLVLLVFGLQGLGRLDTAGWMILGMSLSIAVALGFARGTTFRIWSGPDGQALMRGTPLTFGLWVLTFAVKFALTYAEARMGLGAEVSSTLFLPAAVTLAAQALVVYLRAQDLRCLGYRLS